MFHTYCGGCSNRVDPVKAVVWQRPSDGKYLYFCSEECRLVGENIEPPAVWGDLRRGTMTAKGATRLPSEKSVAPKPVGHN